MTTSILTIGLKEPLLGELRSADTQDVINTGCCQDAIDVLPIRDISTIVFDTTKSNDVSSDVQSLLSATPITTKIVLITPTTNIVENQKFTGLGVATLTAPITSIDLLPFFH